MRRYAGFPVVAWVAVELYLTIVPMLGTAPRWMFEASRLVLLGTGLATVFVAVIAAARHRRDLRGAAFIWFMLALAAASVCMLRWVSMTYPFFA